jgi:regulator of replication initiation timing
MFDDINQLKARNAELETENKQVHDSYLEVVTENAKLGAEVERLRGWISYEVIELKPDEFLCDAAVALLEEPSP